MLKNFDKKSDEFIYNAKQSHESDLAWESIGLRKKIDFLGIPLFLIRRGRLLRTKSNDKRPSIFIKTNLLLFIQALRSTKNIYIGYDRPSLLNAINYLEVDDCEKYLINENNIDSKLEMNYDNSIIFCRYLFIIFAFLFLPPLILYYAIRMELKYFEIGKIIGDIALARFLLLISNKQKKIYFWGGIPFAVVLSSNSNFFEVQHGIIHNYYPTLADQNVRKTPMIVWMNGHYDKIAHKNLMYIKLKNKYKVEVDLNGVGLCGTTDGDINCRAINAMQYLGVNLDYFKKHPRDSLNYKINNADFLILLRLETIYTFPSSIIQDLIINNYNGNLCVLNVFNISEENFKRQVMELYFGYNQDFSFKLSFWEISC